MAKTAENFNLQRNCCQIFDMLTILKWLKRSTWKRCPRSLFKKIKLFQNENLPWLKITPKLTKTPRSLNFRRFLQFCLLFEKLDRLEC